MTIRVFLRCFSFGEVVVLGMSRASGIVPDESMLNEFKRQCLSTENWLSKYDKNGMEVWVEVAPLSSQGNKGNYSKIHKIKVSWLNKYY